MCLIHQSQSFKLYQVIKVTHIHGSFAVLQNKVMDDINCNFIVVKCQGTGLICISELVNTWSTA
ncbi:hypothetical protein EXN66_Car006309 [Channa argus]|uniref:Uncharacterized protein n=1 Tax=Channa argus TaxID=215402 RepID=A0A6G1PKV1_CHAAH|nr:hypothetical protein EXN66_Car006309 [Channa argus]